MGERKGTNKYYPPDYDPRRGGLNKFLGTHALRERARKLHMGILIIRFEMPFNVWCEGCGNHVGMGVRYNAEKKQVGMYFTTPIFEFRMKCHLCDNHFVIKTDPEHFDYECVEGVRRQERRWDMAENEQIASMEKEKSRKLAADAMYKLEHVESDEAKAKAAGPEVEKLEALQHRMKDDFARNQQLRKMFRTKKKELKKQAEVDQTLLSKSSLDIPLVPETEDDRRLASMIAKYRTVESVDEKRKRTLDRLDKNSIFSMIKRNTKKRPVDSPSFASVSSSSASSSGGTSNVHKLASLKDELREINMSSKLLKLEHELEDQKSTVMFLKRKKEKDLETNVDAELLRDSEEKASSSAHSSNAGTSDGVIHATTSNNLSILQRNYAFSDDSSDNDNDA